MPQYADQLYMLINGIFYEIASVDWDISFGKKTPVPTMNPTGRPLGTKQEVGEGSFTVEAPVRLGQPRWSAIEDALITFHQRVAGPPLYTAIGASYSSLSASANTDGEQMNKVEFVCLDWRET